MAVRVTLLLLLLVEAYFKGATSQALIAITYPFTSDADPAIIDEPVNTTNVELFCQVIRSGSGTKQNVWRIIRPDNPSESIRILFNSTTGIGRDGFENFFVEFETFDGISYTVPSNLTIRVFNNSFDHVNISCGTGAEAAINGTFRLRIIGECSSTCI